MDLYILRHGIAEDRDKTSGKADSQRRLTSEGEQKMRRIAKGLKSLGLEFDLILSSPYLRARQTAEIVAEVFGLSCSLEMSGDLTPNGNPRDLIDSLNGAYSDRESIVVIGHEPYLSSLVSLLISGGTGLDVTLKKGGLCKLEIERLKYGRCASLEWLLAPKATKALSRA